MILLLYTATIKEWRRQVWKQKLLIADRCICFPPLSPFHSTLNSWVCYVNETKKGIRGRKKKSKKGKKVVRESLLWELIDNGETYEKEWILCCR